MHRGNGSQALKQYEYKSSSNHLRTTTLVFERQLPFFIFDTRSRKATECEENFLFPLKLTVWWQVDALQVYRNLITIFLCV